MLTNPTQTLHLGIRACSQGEWSTGLAHLSCLEHWADTHRGQVPGLFYSYLGHAAARCSGRKVEGLEMCLYAIEIEPGQPMNYLNLARFYILGHDRPQAVHTLRRGLALDPEHEGLLSFQRTLGVRRPPVIPFLSREHPLNCLLGRWRTRRSAS